MLQKTLDLIWGRPPGSKQTNKQPGRLAKEHKMEEYSKKILLLGMGGKLLEKTKMFRFC